MPDCLVYRFKRRLTVRSNRPLQLIGGFSMCKQSRQARFQSGSQVVGLLWLKAVLNGT
jgi:hypothetical protein